MTILICRRPLICPRLLICLMLVAFQLVAQVQGKERFVVHPTSYRTVQVDGLSIFYREAGPKDAPTLLLLHGFG